jgi:hypothetical protein
MFLGKKKVFVVWKDLLSFRVLQAPELIIALYVYSGKRIHPRNEISEQLFTEPNLRNVAFVKESLNGRRVAYEDIQLSSLPALSHLKETPFQVLLGSDGSLEWRKWGNYMKSLSSRCIIFAPSALFFIRHRMNNAWNLNAAPLHEQLRPVLQEM